MSVDGVNGNNNTALYTGIGAVAGAGAGVAAGYLTKPFLKDGAPTDTFLKKVEANVVKTLSLEEQKEYEQTKQKLETLKNIKTKDELKQLVQNSDLDAQLKIDTLGEIDTLDFEVAKKTILDSMENVVKSKDSMIKGAFESSWDANKKKFVHDAENISLEGFNAVKNAARSIQGKYVAIYGSIGAAVLGLGTYLCTKGKGSNSAAQTANTAEQKPNGNGNI